MDNFTLLTIAVGALLALFLSVPIDRNSYLPDVPTPRELGIDIDPVVVSRGVSAPPNTSPAIVNVLEQALRRVSKYPGFIDWARKNKVVLTPMSAKEFRKIVEDTYPMVEKFQCLLKEG